MRPTVFVLALSIFAILGGGPTAAQQRYQTLGPNECLNCHDHQNERQWYEKQEIADVQKRFSQKGASAGHINALKQLEAAKSNDFAKAVGLKDKYDVKGSCVRCHGTVFSGDANAGVSCESCHGAASGYLKPHQSKGAYEQSTGLGMTKLIGNVQAWAQQCTSCHVLDDQRLIAAGHPSGDDFDLGAKYGPVALHFKKKYGANDVNAIGRQQVAAIIAKRRGGAAPAAAAAAPPPAAAPASAAAVAPTVAARSSAPAPVPAPAAARAAAPLPTAAAPAASASANAPRRPVSAAPPSPTHPSAPVPAPVPTPEIAAVAPPAAVPAVALPPAASVALPSSLSAAVALVQGRLIATLTDILQRGATVPARTGAPTPVLAPYSGPDAALLELQREAIGLALEALGTAPAAPAVTPQR